MTDDDDAAELARRLSTPQAAAVEAAFGLALPGPVRAFFCDGRAHQTSMAYATTDGARFSIAWFLPLDPATVSTYSLPGPFLPIATDGCFSAYVLDLSDGRVLFWDEDEEEPAVVAADFETFAKGLRPE